MPRNPLQIQADRIVPGNDWGRSRAECLRIGADYGRSGADCADRPSLERPPRGRHGDGTATCVGPFDSRSRRHASLCAAPASERGGRPTGAGSRSTPRRRGSGGAPGGGRRGHRPPRELMVSEGPSGIPLHEVLSGTRAVRRAPGVDEWPESRSVRAALQQDVGPFRGPRANRKPGGIGERGRPPCAGQGEDRSASTSATAIGRVAPTARPRRSTFTASFAGSSSTR